MWSEFQQNRSKIVEVRDDQRQTDRQTDRHTHTHTHTHTYTDRQTDRQPRYFPTRTITIHSVNEMTECEKVRKN